MNSFIAFTRGPHFFFRENSRSLVYPLYIYASSGIVRAFNTHTASVRAYTHDDRVPFECRDVSGAVESLLSEIYVRTWMSMALCAAHAHIRNGRRK